MNELQRLPTTRPWNAWLLVVVNLMISQNVVADIIIDESTTFDSDQWVHETIQVVDGESPPTILEFADGIDITADIGIESEAFVLNGVSVLNSRGGRMSTENWSSRTFITARDHSRVNWFEGSLGTETLDAAIELLDNSQFTIFGGVISPLVTVHDSSSLIVRGGGFDGRGRRSIEASGSATVTVTGGGFGGGGSIGIVARETSHIEMSDGASMGQGISLNDSATAEITGGRIKTDLRFVEANDSSVANIRGGIFESETSRFGGTFAVRNDATINIHGGIFLDETIFVRDNGEVHIFGTDLEYFPNDFSGAAIGSFIDGTTFELNFNVAEQSQHDNVILHEIPESSSFAMVLAALLWRRNRDRSSLLLFRPSGRTQGRFQA